MCTSYAPHAAATAARRFRRRAAAGQVGARDLVGLYSADRALSLSGKLTKAHKH